jgi:hypothetical protein
VSAPQRKRNPIKRHKTTPAREKARKDRFALKKMGKTTRRWSYSPTDLKNALAECQLTKKKKRLRSGKKKKKKKKIKKKKKKK